VIVAASCGDGVISQDQIVADLPAAILPDYPELIDEIDCQPEIGLDPIMSSQCTATLADAPITFTVTASADGDDSVVVDLVESVITTAPLIAQAEAALRSDLGGGLDVECATEAAIVAARGTRIACTAVAETGHPFSILLLDSTGDYRIDLS
jgi:hypothetical protein